MISIVVPAHNEASVIGRCIRTLFDGAQPGELEVVVACNGCTDDTASVAAGAHPDVVVLETPRASKVDALNLGDAAASAFPRFYVDADVELGIDSIRAVTALLEAGSCLAAAPRRHIDLQGSTLPVRWFYRVWNATPYVRSGMIGCGVYALSRSGRNRFEHFPPVIADDAYVRSLFTSAERGTVDEPPVVVRAPRTFSALLKARTRSRLGLYELRREFPELAAREQVGKNYSALSSIVLREPGLWLPAIVYLFTNVLARVRATRQLHRLDDYHWERDDTTR